MAETLPLQRSRSTGAHHYREREGWVRCRRSVSESASAGRPHRRGYG